MSIYLMHILAGSGTRILLDKVFGIQNVAIHLLLGVLIGVYAPLFAQQLILHYRIDFLLSAKRVKSNNST